MRNIYKLHLLHTKYDDYFKEKHLGSYWSCQLNHRTADRQVKQPGMGTWRTICSKGNESLSFPGRQPILVAKNISVLLRKK